MPSLSHDLVIKSSVFIVLKTTLFSIRVGTLVPSSKICKIIYIICACLLIFFDFLQSDWLQQRAAFYDILTVVQKCYFFKTDQGVELIVELE